ncbi:uncharacterized protein LOC106752925, partial [Vigna radiata var. radiata]|uniref:Uncharacterized protein LOC106752925 n=1 Tax=Vigna radiata var. radiata TaxID=3916 RepID=A0A1S3T8W0_VIGRR
MQLRVKGPNGSIRARGLLDSGAMTTILTNKCADAIGVTRRPGTSHIEGIDGMRGSTCAEAVVTLTSPSHQVISKNHTVLLIDSITTNVPPVPISTAVRRRLADLPLADPDFDRPGPIDILIGADLYARIVTGPATSLGPSMPSAFETNGYGYIILGAAPSQTATLAALTTGTDEPVSEVHKTIQRFWQLEEVRPPNIEPTPEDPAELLFQQTTRRDASGRFYVRLPFARSPDALGNSRDQALQRFRALERRFRSDPNHRDLYVKFMEQYEADGFMSPAPPDALINPHYFLPHHGV